MVVRFGLLCALMLTWSCSGGDEQPKEPVAAPAAAEKIPDNPGAGETAAKPAGAGQAAAAPAAPTPAPVAVPAPAPAPEKSQPNVAGAATTTAGGKMVVNAGALNVRKGPSMKSEVARVLKHGEHITATGCTKGWCKLGENEFAAQKFLDLEK